MEVSEKADEHLVEEDEENNVVAEARQAMKHGHPLGRKGVSSVQVKVRGSRTHLMMNEKKSSMTVERTL